MLAIAWQFLTGSYRASDTTDRTQPEWPPHPDRVFQALVAAWGECGERQEWTAALEWLESLGPPLLSVPNEHSQSTGQKAFVPMNDVGASDRQWKKGAYSDRLKSILPAQRVRKPRFFPKTWVGDGICALIWPDAEIDEHRAALEQICSEVTRIGHSSSLVRCWIEDTPPPASWVPSSSNHASGMRLRIPSKGRFKRLYEVHRAASENGLYEGTPRSKERTYVLPSKRKGVPHTVFSPALTVFRRVSGDRYDLADTLGLTQALRAALIASTSELSVQAREILSGHKSDGAPLQDVHAAYIPLPFVGHQNADGHLLGIAISLPQNLSIDVEDSVLGAIAEMLDERGRMKLYLGRQGEMELELVDSMILQLSLQPLTWSVPSTSWATVTPIVMDRMQNARRSEPDVWAAEQIMGMCARVGLPNPEQITVRSVSAHSGAPPVAKMPPIRRKDGSSRRMVHAVLQFDQQVQGPVILGSGRYRGYGLCKPIHI